MTEPIDTNDIRRRLVSGEIRNPTEVLFAALKEVDCLKDILRDLRETDSRRHQCPNPAYPNAYHPDLCMICLTPWPCPNERARLALGN